MGSLRATGLRSSALIIINNNNSAPIMIRQLFYSKTFDSNLKKKCMTLKNMMFYRTSFIAVAQ